MAWCRNNNIRSSDQWPGLVAKLREAERRRKGKVDPDKITLRSGCNVSMTKDKNNHAVTGNITPPITQPPNE
eukprot:13502113-Ditylum_brightwellii.AAC.1